MPTQAPPAARRCQAHNLAAGPDGHCALCRRKTQPIAAELEVKPAAASDLLRWLLGAGLLASLAGLAYQTYAPRPLTMRSVAQAATRATATPTRPGMTNASGPAMHAQPRSTNGQPRPEPTAAAKQPEQPTKPRPPTTVAPDPAELRRRLEIEAQDRTRHQEVQRELAALDLAAARRDVKITMYSTSWCGVCARARAYMTAHNIAFTDLDVEADPAARARAAALNPRGGVPTIAIDDEVLVGFSPSSLQARIARAAHRRVGDLK